MKDGMKVRKDENTDFCRTDLEYAHGQVVMNTKGNGKVIRWYGHSVKNDKNCSTEKENSFM